MELIGIIIIPIILGVVWMTSLICDAVVRIKTKEK